MATAVRADFSSNESTSATQIARPRIPQAVTFRCGDAVPAPGTYWVIHQKHRETHASKVRFTMFPPCAQCGNKVRFIAADGEKGRITEWLRRDPDFKQALKPVRRRRRANREND